MMSLAIASHMAAAGVKTVGFIGFSDAYGEGWFREFSKVAPLKGLTIIASERYARTDTSVTGQVLKLVAAKPDAVLIAASGTPAVLPQRTLKERGYAGKYYQTHGVANNDFLRVGGKDVDGTFLPAGPVLVAAQLPANHPVRPSALEYINKYEAAYGKGSVSTFGAHAWDAGRLMAVAAAQALKKAQPGTAGVPRRAARRARVGARGPRRARHLQHVADRPPRPRPARARHGQDRERRLASTNPEVSHGRPAEPDRRPLGRQPRGRPRWRARSTAA